MRRSLVTFRPQTQQPPERLKRTSIQNETTMTKLIFVGTIFSGNPRSALQRAKSGDWLTHHITNEVVQLCHGMPLLEPIPHPSSSIPALLRRFHLWTNLGGNLDSRSCSRWCSQGICLGATIVSCQGIRDQDANSCTYRLVMIGSLRFLVPAEGFQPEFWNLELGHLWPHGIP